MTVVVAVVVAGIGGPLGALSPGEFRDALDLNIIPRSPITFTPEDDAWLLAKY